ncbi:HAD family hydrolase [Formosa sp. S-31]|uniref:HAD family hydrolase n=1 Tax=Formosa sp. S-31 TaxID=2790949 RepID=UPI003EBAE4EC
MGKYKCVIFDCDGVLVDSEALSNGVLAELANEHGADLNLESAIKLFKGGSVGSCISKIEKRIGKTLPESFESDYRRISFEIFKTEMKAIEGVSEVLQQLEIPFCVASSGPEEKIRLNLGVTGLLNQFEGKIFSCYTINTWKPDPAVFLWAAKTMGFSPDECLVIEDSFTGVTAAKAGGFDVFGFTQQDIYNELQGHATKTFNHMNQLLDLMYHRE